MLQDRASGAVPGGAGLRQGDIVSYIIESVPSPNGATLGAAGYITDYIPPGTQVVGASFVQKVPDPSLPGGFGYVDDPVPAPGILADGWGPRGPNGYLAPSFAEGRLAQGVQDTGIFFSTDPRTARIAVPYDVTACTKAKLAGGQAAFLVYNQWDYDQFIAFGDSKNLCPGSVAAKAVLGGSGRGNPPLVATANPLAPWAGLASPVAGPQTYYTNDYNPLAGAGVLAFSSPGPWQRISYQGSLIGGSGPVTPAVAQGTDTITGVPTSAGWNLSAGNPLPPTTNAVRFAIGERQVGTVEHVKISLKITDLAAFSAGNLATPGFTNQSSVFGADASGGAQGGKDHAYAYLGPSQANNNAQLVATKQVVAVSNTPTGPWIGSDGAFIVSPYTFVKYRLSYVNAASGPLYNFSLTDIIDAANSAAYVPLSATTGNPYLAVPVAGIGTVTWSNPVTPITLLPGDGGYVELVVDTTGVATSSTQNTVHGHATTLPVGGLAVDSYGSALSTMSLTGAPPSITQTKSVLPSAAAPLQPVRYSITLNNSGGAINAATKGNNKANKGPIYPATAGIALVVGDTLPVVSAVPPVKALTYTPGSDIVTLIDTNTGIPYPMAAGTNYTVDTTTRPGDVFWIINTYPALFPGKGGLPFDFSAGQLQIDFYATVAAATPPGVYYNQVESYHGDWDFVKGKQGKDISKLTPNLAPVSVLSPDFSTFTKTATDINGGVPAPADIIQYTFTATNTGAASATNVVLTDPIPLNASFVVGSVSAPGASLIDYYSNGLPYVPVGAPGTIDPYVTEVHITYPTIAPLASVTPSLQVQISPAAANGTTILNQATLTTTVGLLPLSFVSDDPAQPGTQDFTRVDVVANPDFSTSRKSVLVNGAVSATASPGDTLAYTINFADTGNDPGGATNVIVEDIVDLNVIDLYSIVVAAPPAGWLFTGPDSTGRIVWSKPATIKGETASLSFTGTVKAGLANGTAINNSASISSDQTTPFIAQAPTLTVPQTQVSGTVYADINGNGVLDAGETGIGNVSVALRAPGSGFDTASVLTDPYGSYTLQAPAPGNWNVLVTDTGGVLAGYTLTTTNPLNVTLSNGVTLANQHFGYQPPASPATITGTIYNDLNGDGTRQAPGESGIAGVTLQLKNAAGTVVGTATTNAAGLYSFGSLAAGNYTLEVTDTAGVLVNDYQTTLPATPIPFTVAAGTTTTSDIGYRIGSRIGDLVFADTNNNGIFDIGETGIPGVTIDLKQGAVVIASTTTDINGAYLFQGVAPGTYQVVVTDTAGKLTGFSPTTAVTSPYTVTASSGNDTLTGDFGYNAPPGFIVTKTVDKGTAGFNTAVQYTITIDNYGGAAQNFVVRDMLPSTSAVLPYNISASNFLYLSTDSVTMNGVPFTIPNLPLSLSNQPTWSGFTMPAASTLTIVFTAFTGANEGLHYNGVHTEYNNNAGGLPPVTANDYPNLAIVTISSAGTVSKQVTAINGVPWAGPGNPVVTAGDVITYRITLANTPAAVSQSVVDIYEQMPAGFTYQPGSSVLTAPVNPQAAPVPTQVGQQLIWSFVGPLYPATNGGVPLGYPSTVTLDFNLIVPAGVSGTFTDLAQMNVMLNGLPPVIPLSSGNTAPVDVTSFRAGDLVFIDKNGDGLFQPGTDSYAAGVTLALRNNGSPTDLQTTTTDVNGAYQFIVPAAGTYDVVVTDTAGVLSPYSSTTGGNTQTVTLSLAQPVVLTADFGYKPAQPSLLILKTVNTVSDPVNGTTNPFNIPGSVVQYNLIVTNSGAGSPDANSVVLVDPIPANTAMFFPSGAAPFTFTDGAVPSGLTCTFVSLADPTDCIDFSNTAAPYTWTYVPAPANGVDTNVTAIRIKPAGTMAPASGGNNPSFTASFKVQVK